MNAGTRGIHADAGRPWIACEAVNLMKDIVSAGPKRHTGRWIVTAILGATAAFMYVSIMLKIIKFGP